MIFNFQIWIGYYNDINSICTGMVAVCIIWPARYWQTFRHNNINIWCKAHEINGQLWRGVFILSKSLQWRNNGRDNVSNHQPHDCFLNRLFRHRSKKTSKIRVTGLCGGNSPVTGEFPTQMCSNAENVSIWWRHHVMLQFDMLWDIYVIKSVPREVYLIPHHYLLICSLDISRYLFSKELRKMSHGSPIKPMYGVSFVSW